MIITSDSSSQLSLNRNISTSFLTDQNTLPLVINPITTDIDLKIWIIENRKEVENDIIKYGGILFRGFGIDTIDKFNSLMQIFRETGFDYVFRSSPRHSLAERVYESTTYPKDRKINMHSEQSYSYALIQKIVFCCITPAAEQGETPIANNRRILNSINPELKEKFSRLRILYQRNLSPNIGMRWQDVFQTNDSSVVKKNCDENNISYVFGEDDNLLLRWTKPALITHPVSGEESWFNHCFFFNKYSLYEEMGIDYTEGLPEEFLSYDTFFGDGTEISYQEYTDIKNAYHQEKIVFPWQRGDVLFLDNMLSSHGRSPFKGDRQIVVSMI